MPKLGEEGDGCVEVIDDDTDIVYALNRHVPKIGAASDAVTFGRVALAGRSPNHGEVAGQERLPLPGRFPAIGQQTELRSDPGPEHPERAQVRLLTFCRVVAITYRFDDVLQHLRKRILFNFELMFQRGLDSFHFAVDLLSSSGGDSIAICQPRIFTLDPRTRHQHAPVRHAARRTPSQQGYGQGPGSWIGLLPSTGGGFGLAATIDSAAGPRWS